MHSSSALPGDDISRNFAAVTQYTAELVTGPWTLFLPGEGRSAPDTLTGTHELKESTMGAPIDPGNFVTNNNMQQQNYVDMYNANVTAQYTLAVANYNLSMDNGSPYPGAAPTVPNGMVLGPANSMGLRFAQYSGLPACMALPIHPLRGSTNDPKPPGVIDVGHAIGGNWWSVGDADSFPVGQTTPPVTTEDGAN